jgi:flagellar FliL protein
MSEAEEAPPEVEEKKKLPVKAIVFTAAGAIAMGAVAAGASFVLAPGGDKCSVEAAKEGDKSGPHGDIKDVAFVNIEPLVVTLGENARSRYLKITISLETTKTHEKSLNTLTPRIRDTLNNYLRAVEEDDLVRPASMARLRAQMLRRLQLVAPSEVISDILITDFVLT